MAQTYEHVTHTFPPIFDEHSRILILGSFPSVKSRENQFYYGHPQNRFWKVLAAVCGVPAPGTIEEKKKFLLKIMKNWFMIVYIRGKIAPMKYCLEQDWSCRRSSLYFLLLK